MEGLQSLPAWHVSWFHFQKGVRDKFFLHISEGGELDFADSMHRAYTGDGPLAKQSGALTQTLFDMLGEGARTAEDAARYLKAYQHAIDGVAAEKDKSTAPEQGNGVSVKMSALHPRYEAVNRARIMDEMYPSVLELCERAAKANINLCLDAEEADRLVLSLQILDRLAREG